MPNIDNSHYYTFILGLLCPDSLVSSLDISIVQYIIAIAKILDYSCSIDRFGTKTWAYRDGRRHRGGDLPAVIRVDGTHEWYNNGMRHRGGDLPAVIRADGTCEWYTNGVRHRDGDLPAVIARDYIAWYDSGLLHRDGDLPTIIMMDGRRIWHKRGKRTIFRGIYYHST